ncbi:hypothetical protein [Buttiauxella sp. A111]|uniref:hypothetical protein n=1 Tax=Buttiauxella sp. A111 TaxID=2563088 RepID=UPI0010D25089|nr:hypothetical protein [Buttiauxella sp. A111]GDX08080.1 hypothetical protein BSPA111_43070 [Buttiauxella sp. A111]
MSYGLSSEKITRFGDYMLQDITINWSITLTALSLVPRGTLNEVYLCRQVKDDSSTECNMMT